MGTALDDRPRGVVLDADDHGGADAGRRGLAARLAVGPQRLPDETVGVEPQLLDDLGPQLHVVVRVQVGRAADQRLHDVVGVREGQGTRDAEGRGTGGGGTGGGGGRARGRAGEGRRGGGRAGRGGVNRRQESQELLERRAARLRVRVRRLLGPVVGQLEEGEVRRRGVGQAGRGVGPVGGVEPAEHAERGEVGVENLRRAEAEPGGTGGDGPQVDARDAPAGLVFEGPQADRLGRDQPVVAGQVELIDAGHHVVDPAVLQPRNGGGALVVNDRLAQFERVAEGAEGDRVLGGIDPGRVEASPVQRHRHAGVGGRGRQVDPLAVDGVLLVPREPDEFALVDGGRGGVVLRADDVVRPPGDEAADRVAAPRRVRDRVFGDDDPVDRFVVLVVDADEVPGVVDVADLVGVGGRRVELHLDDFAARRVHVGGHRAVHAGHDVRLRELERQRHRRGAVGGQAGAGLRVGIDAPQRADVHRPTGVNRRRVGHRGQRGDDRVGDRDRAGEGVRQGAAPSARRPAGLLLAGGRGLRAHVGGGPRVRGNVHRPAPLDEYAGGHVDRGRGRRLGVADAEEGRAAGLAGARGGGGRVDADDVVGQEATVHAEGYLRLRALHQHFDREGGQVVEEAQGRVREEVRLERGQAESLRERPVLGLGDQVDARRRQGGPWADIDGHGLAQEAGREQVLEFGGGHPAGAEHDVAGQAWGTRDAGGQRHPRGDDDAVREHLQVAAVRGHVPLEPHRVSGRVRLQRRRAAFVAVEQKVGGKQRVERPDDDRVGTRPPAHGQRVGRADELERTRRHGKGTDEIQPFVPDAGAAWGGPGFQHDGLAEDRAGDADVVRVAARERVEVVHAGVADRRAVDRHGPGLIDGRGVERRVVAGGLEDRETVRSARAAGDGAGHAAALLEPEGVAGDQAGTGQVLEPREADGLHRAGIRPGDAPDDLRVFGAVERVRPGTADDRVDGRERAHAGGDGRRQVDVHRPGLCGIVQGIDGGRGAAVDIAAAVDGSDRTTGRDSERVVATAPD